MAPRREDISASLKSFTLERFCQSCASSLAPRSRKRNVIALLNGGVGVYAPLQRAALQRESALEHFNIENVQMLGVE